MIEITWATLQQGEISAIPAALTVGVFDGIHTGHRELISRITSLEGTSSVVVTFRQHPGEVLADRPFPGLIMTLAQKRKALADSGVDIVVLVDFSHEFSTLSGTDFLDRLLRSVNLRYVVLGHDFRCGHRLDTDAPAAQVYLEPRGVNVEIVEAVHEGGSLVSSTRIRQLILDGEMHRASKLLGCPFTLDVTAETVRPDGSWRSLAVSSRRVLASSKQLLPAPGLYQADFVSDDTTVAETLVIEENCIRWQLPDHPTIRYIVLRTRRN